MTWLARRRWDASDHGPGAAFAEDLAAVVERSFPIDETAITAVRARILDAFVASTPVEAPARTRRPTRRGWGIAIAASAGLMVFGVSAVQAGPGSLFYPVRLSIETATLPDVDSGAGWQARLDRLERRMHEGLSAEADRDPGALGAALSEYRSELAGLVAGSVDTGQRAALIQRASTDLDTVMNLDLAFPSPAATLLIADIRALTQPPLPNGIGRPGPDEPIRGNPHEAGAIGDPHDGLATGDPHGAGQTGDPHTDGVTGDPHSNGTPGTKPDAAKTTGSPPVNNGSGSGGSKPAGTTGNPHSGGSGSGNPHSGGSGSGNPHDGGTKGKP